MKYITPLRRGFFSPKINPPLDILINSTPLLNLSPSNPLKPSPNPTIYPKISPLTHAVNRLKIDVGILDTEGHCV